MKRKTSTLTILLFVVSIAMVLISTVGIAVAALTESKRYEAEINMKDIGVTLMETGKEVEGDNLFFEIDPKDFLIGVTYPEVITVSNSGTIDEYVRVIVKKYWCDDADPEAEESEYPKNNGLNPDYIEVTINDEDWIKDPNASTEERDVYYYRTALKPAADGAPADVSAPLIEEIKINNEVKQIVDIEIGDDGKPYGTFTYSGKWFALEVEVDAVQTHHAKDAFKSVWGVDATIDEANKTVIDVKS